MDGEGKGFTARLLSVALAALGCCLWATTARGDDEAAAIRVQHDPRAFVTTIRVPARDGSVAWFDILRGVSRARGFDDGALADPGPRGAFPIDSPLTRPILAAINAASAPDIRFSILEPEVAGAPRALRIRLDRRALLASQREIARRLRGRVAAGLKATKSYGLRLDNQWERAAVEQSVVVLVHGLQSSGNQMANLLVRPRAAGLPCGVFDYPNDQPIQESAELLARELHEFQEAHPERRVTLLAHSMGGLVARAVVEDAKLNPGNVDQLIMISPPNHGSVLAEFGFGLDLFESVLHEDRRDRARWAAAAIEDGLASAQTDLQPGSPFLTVLNARPRNSDVRYTIILGDVAELTPEELIAARRVLARAGASNRWVRFFGSRVDAWLADLDEVIDGRGDGVVALKRGRLAGVKDTVVRRFGHLSFNESPMTGETDLVLEDVMRRLTRD